MRKNRVQQINQNFFYLGLVLALAILIAVGVDSYNSIRSLIAAADQVDDSIQTLSALDDVLISAVNAETGQRGYLITGDSAYLQPYKDARSQIGQDVQKLEQFVANDPAQSQPLVALKSAIAAMDQELQATIDLRQSQGFDAAQQLVSSDKGKALMDDMRRIIAGMETHENNRLQPRLAERVDTDRRTPIVVVGGTLLALLITVISATLLRRDMHLRGQAEQGLRESEARFRALAENAAASLFIAQDDGFRYVNPATAAISGYRVEELLTMNFLDLIHPEQREMVRALQSAWLRGKPLPPRYEFKMVARDGSERWGEVSGGMIQYEGRPAVVGLAYDITDRKRAEQQIQRQVERLNALRAIDRAITGSLDLRLTLDMLLGELLEQLGVDAATVLLLEANTQTLGYAAGRGFRTAAIQRTRLRVGEGYAGQAALERRSVHIPTLTAATNGLARAFLQTEEGFTAYWAMPLIAKGQVKGVLEVFHRTPREPNGEWLSFLETLAGQAAIAIDNVALFDDLQRSNTDLLLAYDSTIEGWSRALDLRDKETEGHSRRVTEMTLRLARAIGISNSELVHVRRGALLHDIGKMGVPDAILLKPGALTEDEWKIMRQHPQLAFDMLASIAYLRPALDIPYCHHEKWDGTGYPHGLKGEQIPLAARIFAIVDVYDALTSDRPYRKAWNEGQVREHLRAQTSAHFDPSVVEAFLKMGGLE